MKKYLIYIVILVVGVLVGKFIFSAPTSSEKSQGNNELTVKNQMWTCSMHPQIMQPEAGDCPICGMDLIPAETSADGLAADEFKLTKNALALANIQTTVIGSSDAEENNATLSGKIHENEENNAVQVSYFAGRIEKLNISFTGEKVRKGQLLATIYAPELVAAQQELLTSADLKESQPELYRAVRNKLKLWKLSEKQINQIEASGKVKQYFPIYATVAGTVTKMLATEGDYLKQGQPLFKIANLNSVWALFDAYEKQIASFKIGQEIEINSNAYPNTPFKAKISFIDPILNTKTRTVKVRAVLDNKSEVFKPGMFVNGIVKGIEGITKDLITIPATAVLWTGKRSVVYVKTNPKESVFKMREVTLGESIGGNRYQIIEGLKNGEEIVTNGTFTVDAAAQLQGKKSMMNTSGGEVMTGHEGHLGMEKIKSKGAEVHELMSERIKVNKTFQKQLKIVFDNYLKLKNELVLGQPEVSKEAAKSLAENLAKVDMKLLNNKEAHNHWMLLDKEMSTSAKTIAKTIDIKVQRTHFKHLSSHFINAVQVFGIDQTVYKQFCPMAENDTGGYWLSTEEEIRNPYFGDMMLKCGEVKDTIK